MNGFLLDTMVVSEAIRPTPSLAVLEWLRETAQDLLFLSALTIGEIQFGISRLATGQRRRSLENWLKSRILPVFDGRILPIDEHVSKTWGELAARASKVGVRAGAVDELIAATAATHGLSVVTRNVGDFSTYGVHVTNPWAVDTRP